MAKCPNCEKDVKNPKKTWKMAGRPDKNGKRTQLIIGTLRVLWKKLQEGSREKENLNISETLIFFLERTHSSTQIRR
jgi:hypothetical protein